MEQGAPNPDWVKDSLSEFLHLAQHNTVASVTQLKVEYALLVDVDHIFQTLLANLNNSPEWFMGLFVLKAHSAWLAACRVALSGQDSETFLLLRAVLENALYGSYVSRHHGAQEVWLRRHDDQVSLKKMKSVFTIKNMFDDLEAAGAAEAEVAGKLYQRTIDFGGHPNEMSLTQSLKLGKLPNAVHFEIVYLHGPSLTLTHSLKTVAQVGTTALSIFRPLFKQRFDILELTEKLDKLRAKL